MIKVLCFKISKKFTYCWLDLSGIWLQFWLSSFCQHELIKYRQNSCFIASQHINYSLEEQFRPITQNVPPFRPDVISLMTGLFQSN